MPDVDTAIDIATGALGAGPQRSPAPGGIPEGAVTFPSQEGMLDAAKGWNIDLSQFDIRSDAGGPSGARRWAAVRKDVGSGAPSSAGASDVGASDPGDEIGSKIGIAQAGAQGKLPTPPTPQQVDAPGYYTGVRNSVMRGASFGFSDEIDAARDAATRYLVSQLSPDLEAPQSIGNFYDAALSRNRAQGNAFAKQNPVAATTGNVVGSLAAAPARVAAGAATAAAPWLRTLGGNTLAGAGFGAVSGFGNDQGDLTDRLKAAAYGGAMGGGIGAASPLIGRTIAAPFGWGMDLARPFFNGGRERIAGDVLARAAGNGPVAAQAAPIPGMQLSTGQATNNPGLLWLERSMQGASPAAAEVSAAARTGNNQALRGAIGQLGDIDAPDAAQRMAGALTDAQRAGRTTERSAWQSIDPNQNSWIPTQPFKDSVEHYLTQLPKAYRPYVPADVLDTIGNQFGRVESIDQFQALRSTIGSEIRASNAAGNANRARILGGLQDLLDTHLENLPGVPPDMLQRYGAARAASRDYNATFKQPDVRQALGVDASGMPRLPDSATADKFIRKGRGGPEAWQAYLNAAGGNPAALEAARDAFAQKFLDAASTRAPDAAGDALLNAGKIRQFVADHAHVVNSPLFTPAQRQLIGSIADAADMAARTARAGTPGASDAYARLAGDRFIDELIGTGKARVLAGGIGAGAGYVLGEGPGHAVLGALVGEHVGHQAMSSLYGGARVKILGLIDRAMHDPQLASALMQRASQANLMFMPRHARASIMGALAGKLAPYVADSSGDDRRQGMNR